MDWTPGNVETVLSDLYDGQSKSDISAANHWLMGFQHSPAAWSVSWELLKLDKDSRIQFFGASTLYGKITRSWSEVPPADYSVLRDRLLEILLIQASAPPSQPLKEGSTHPRTGSNIHILRRLCAAVAALVVQVIGSGPCEESSEGQDRVESEARPVRHVVSTLEGAQAREVLGEATCYQLVLLVLDSLPQEYENAKRSVQRDVRIRMTETLAEECAPVLSLVENMLASPVAANSLKETALACAAQWMKIGAPKLSDIKGLLLAVFSLVSSTSESSLLEHAVDMLVAAFQAVQKGYPATLKEFLPNILAISPVWAEFINMQDTHDGCVHLSKLVLAFGEQFTHLLPTMLMGDTTKSPPSGVCAEAALAGDEQRMALSFLQLVLTMTNTPGMFPVDESVTDICVIFWANFHDEIMEKKHIPNLDVCVKPILVTLAEVLMNKCEYPDDESLKDICDEDLELFRQYRIDASDLMKQIVLHVPREVTALVTSRLNQVLASDSAAMPGSEPAATTPHYRWQSVEVALYLFEVLDDASTDELWDAQCMSFAVQVLTRLNFTNNSHLVNTALEMLGSCTESLDQSNDSLVAALPFVMHYLGETEHSFVAAYTLRSIVVESKVSTTAARAADLLPSMLKVVQEKSAKLEAMELLAMCVGHLLSLLPHDQSLLWLESFLSPLVETLTSASQPPTAATTPTPSHSASVESSSLHTAEGSPSQNAVCEALLFLTRVAATLSVRQAHRRELCQEAAERLESIGESALSEMGDYSVSSTFCEVGSSLESADSTEEGLYKEPLVAVLERLMPVVSSVSKQWTNCATVVESVSGFLKQCLGTLLEQYEPFFLPSLDLVGCAFSETRSNLPLFITLIQQLLIVFTPIERCKDACCRIFSLVLDSAHLELQQDLREKVDFIQGFLELLTGAAKKFPAIFCSAFSQSRHASADSVIGLATSALLLPEISTVKISSSFLVIVIANGAAMPQCQVAITNALLVIVFNVLKGAGGESLRDCVPFLSEILWSLNQHRLAELRPLLSSVLSQPHFLPHVPNTEKNRFLQAIAKNRRPRSAIKDKVVEFGLLCRGMQNSEYARQTSKPG